MSEAKSTANLYSALQASQLELKAPKNQRNSFGGYDYRSAEDIIEAAKPVLAKHGLVLSITDEIVVMRGNSQDRFYVKAMAYVHLIESNAADHIAAIGWAREPDDKKGMDASQITGAASSYARKYALNGLLAIDDTKDADTDEHRKQTAQAAPPKNVSEAAFESTADDPATESQLKYIRDLRKRLGYSESSTETKIKLVKTKAQAKGSIEKLKTELEVKENGNEDQS